MDKSDAEIAVGDAVILQSVPDWLVHDLPDDERNEILSCIGRHFRVSEIDAYGYFWIGFGNEEVSGGNVTYSGHSIAVTKDCIAKC